MTKKNQNIISISPIYRLISFVMIGIYFIAPVHHLVSQLSHELIHSIESIWSANNGRHDHQHSHDHADRSERDSAHEHEMLTFFDELLDFGGSQDDQQLLPSQSLDKHFSQAVEISFAQILVSERENGLLSNSNTRSPHLQQALNPPQA